MKFQRAYSSLSANSRRLVADNARLVERSPARTMRSTRRFVLPLALLHRNADLAMLHRAFRHCAGLA